MNNNLDNIRETTLKRIEQTERNYKLMFIGAAVIEAFFLGAFLLLANFSDRLHLLLLISSITIYTILGFGLIALGLHVNRNALRIINAIESIEKR
ncbi:MAG TPA: hypothetical protein VK892_22800 [Pyrinomonadaceae bacterium]|nr:hypothetical protein [Pyrinomonadaceae bacterium]